MNAMAEARGGGFMAHMSALALATTVYNIWIERNNRIFQHQVVLEKVETHMRDATWFWKARRTYMHWTTCKEWGLNENRILV